MKKVRYIGNTRVDGRFTHGGLAPVPGVKTYQVYRCNRVNPDLAEDYGWTYNHAPMLCRHFGRFYLSYLSNPVSEHVPPGMTFFCRSEDGVEWTRPAVLFPQYKLEPGTVKRGFEDRPFRDNAFAVMHQRMGWYAAKNGRLLACGYYGLSVHGDNPNDGRGIGRVVREVYADNTLGPVYFIRYNAGYGPDNTLFPFYTGSPDAGFVEACDELLSDPLTVLQWIEESERGDPLIRIDEARERVAALSYYHTSENEVVGLWKWSKVSYSHDNGQSWDPAVREPSLVMAGQKIWGQRTADGKYAAVYTPTPCNQLRYPLAVIVSDDGYTYDNMRLVCGDVAPRRYYGRCKDYGLNYVRGITETNGQNENGEFWVAFSMSKEDIFVSKIPVPVLREIGFPHQPDFSGENALEDWTLYSLIWAPVRVVPFEGVPALSLKDADPVDYAKAERQFPPSEKLEARFSLVPAQNGRGELFIELQDNKGLAHMRLRLSPDGWLRIRAGSEWRKLRRYEAGEKLDMVIRNDCADFSYQISVNGEQASFAACASCDAVSRIVFRTGELHDINERDCTPDTPDIPHCSDPLAPAEFFILSLDVSPV